MQICEILDSHQVVGFIIEDYKEMFDSFFRHNILEN